jgi:hypothetical protein
MTAQEELARRIERDSICRAVQKKIDEGKADFTDTARYNDRAAELLGEVLAAYVPDMPPEERETLCKGLLRQRYLDTNAMLNAVQRTLDAAQGLHLAPQIAEYPEERVDQAAHALADETVPVETIVRRAKSAPATIARSFQDDYIQKNASFRDSAGLKCYITRIAAGGCCKWCTAMAGRYSYGEEPDDIYRRHDNCSCTVTYESGRQRQDVWSKRAWEVPGIGAGAEKPTVYSKEQARQIKAQHSITRLTPEQAKSMQESVLTNAAGSAIIKAEGNPSDVFDRKAALATWEKDLAAVNPHFHESEGYNKNCIYCVPTYVLRRKGFNVEALPIGANPDGDAIIPFSPSCVWEKNGRPVSIQSTAGSKYFGKPEIIEAMRSLPDGVMFEISCQWEKPNGTSRAHVFIAEKVNGRTRFIDPQTGGTDVSGYFALMKKNSTVFWRIDDAQLNEELIEYCCKSKGSGGT